MRLTPLHPQEQERLNELYAYDILDTEDDDAFNDLIDLAATIYGCPLASVTFIDEHRQWTKASKGIEGDREIPRENSICTYTIMEHSATIINDTLEDARFYDLPSVKDGPKIRFYAGFPIASENGYHLGSVCVMDQKPRVMTKDQTSALQTIARHVGKLLELGLRDRQLKEYTTKRLEFEKGVSRSLFDKHQQDRQAIGTELHENIAQGLAATKFFLEALQETMPHPLLTKTTDQVASLVDQVKTLSHSIVPTTLQATNFFDKLRITVDQFRANTKISVSLHFEGNHQMGDELSDLIVRMVMEGLSNSVEHGKATAINLHVINRKNIRVLLEDNGKGVDLENLELGNGLKQMVVLLEHYGGFVDLKKQASGGSVLEISAEHRALRRVAV